MNRVIVGLGSNLGAATLDAHDGRLRYIRLALSILKLHNKLRVLKVSRIYLSRAQLPKQAPSDWNQDYLNCALLIHTELDPLELLDELKTIEFTVTGERRAQHPKWSPRRLDIDILTYEKLSLTVPDVSPIQPPKLILPHYHLFQRPFAVLPALEVGRDLIEGLQDYHRHAAQLELWQLHLESNPRLLPYECQPTPLFYSKVTGIINATPDSFSEQNVFQSVQALIKKAEDFIKDGATVIDVGAESTRPHSLSVSPEEEWRRLEELLPELRALCLSRGALLSLDTRNYETMERGIEAGVDIINDVSAGSDPKVLSLVARSQVVYVATHNLGIPPRGDYTLDCSVDVVSQLQGWSLKFLERAALAGVPASRLIIDPGLGFGKTLWQNWTILKRITELQQMNVGLLVGHSRKAYLTLVSQLPASERDCATAALATHLAQNGIDFIRVHNVRATVNAIGAHQLLQRA